MGFVCEEVKEGDFCPLLSTWEMLLENALFWCVPHCKKTQIKQTPSCNNNKTLTSQRESRGGPRAAQGPAIKEILIKYRTKVSSVVKQRHREPERLCQRSPWFWAEAWTKILQRCTRTPLTFPPPYFSLLNYNWEHHSAHLESKLRHRDPKGFPPAPAETRITFSLIPTSRRLHPMLSFPSTAFPPQGTSTLTQRSVL